jgi:hypothetical protein
MTLKTTMHDKQRAYVAEKLSETLEKVRVTSSLFLEHKELVNADIDRLLSQKDFRQELVSYVGEDPLYDFVSQDLSTRLYDTHTYDSGADPLRLVDVEGFAPAKELAGILLDSMTSLPWNYTICFVLPRQISNILPLGQTQFLLSDSDRIIRIDEEFIKTFPPKSRLEPRNKHIAGGSFFALLGGEHTSWEVGDLVFASEVDGFVGEYGETPPVKAAESRLRAFLGLLFALHLVEQKHLYIPTQPIPQLVVYRKMSADWDIMRKIRLDDDFGKLLPRLHLDRLAEVEESKRAGFIMYGLKLLRPAFGPGLANQRILRSARWLLDSYANSRDLLGFVQAMVSLEIILGDQDETEKLGLGPMIKNRCAYLTGVV